MILAIVSMVTLVALIGPRVRTAEPIVDRRVFKERTTRRRVMMRCVGFVAVWQPRPVAADAADAARLSLAPGGMAMAPAGSARSS